MAAPLAPAATPDYRVSPSVETAYLTLVVGGGTFLIPILLILSCMRGFARHPSLLNFLASWMLYSLASSLLLYTGNAYKAHPPESICVAQVSLQQAALMIIAVSAVGLVLQLWFTLPTVSTSRPHSTIRDLCLVSMPYVFGAVYTAAFYIVYDRAPSYVPVERGRLTCRISEGPNANFFNKFIPGVIGISLIACLIMCIWMLKRTVKRLAGIHWSLKDGLQSSSGRSWLPILTRFAIFGSYSVLCIVAALVIIFTPQGPAHDVVDWFTATLPLAAFLIFVPWPCCSARPEKETPPTQTMTHNLPMQQSSVETLVSEHFAAPTDGKWQQQQQQRKYHYQRRSDHENRF